VAVLFPLLVGVVVALGGFYCLYASMTQRQNATEDAKLWAGAGLTLIVLAAITVLVAVLKRNATEMAVTNRRILIKTGIMSRRTIEKEEAGPSPIRASRVWAQDDNEKQRQRRKGRRPTLDTEGSGTRK
jgi:hypothetical protein